MSNKPTVNDADRERARTFHKMDCPHENGSLQYPEHGVLAEGCRQCLAIEFAAVREEGEWKCVACFSSNTSVKCGRTATYIDHDGNYLCRNCAEPRLKIEFGYEAAKQDLLSPGPCGKEGHRKIDCREMRVGGYIPEASFSKQISNMLSDERGLSAKTPFYCTACEREKPPASNFFPSPEQFGITPREMTPEERQAMGKVYENLFAKGEKLIPESEVKPLVEALKVIASNYHALHINVSSTALNAGKLELLFTDCEDVICVQARAALKSWEKE